LQIEEAKVRWDRTRTAVLMGICASEVARSFTYDVATSGRLHRLDVTIYLRIAVAAGIHVTHLVLIARYIQ